MDISELTQSANAGDDSAQSELGSIYAEGRGVTQDFTLARRWWLKAARQRDAFAMSNLGVLFANGLGVERDVVAGYVWFALAAAYGNHAAMSFRQDIVKQMSDDQVTAALKIVEHWSDAANFDNQETSKLSDAMNIFEE